MAEARHDTPGIPGPAGPLGAHAEYGSGASGAPRDERLQPAAAGATVRLSSRIVRVTAPNPGVMTGPGTNTYLVGDEAEGTWAVIDPGPLDEAHVNAVLAAAPGRITHVLVTHTHIDHSPAAALLQRRHGLHVMGRVADHPDKQDASFAPDRVPQHGERIPLGPRATLRVLHTPGHASNHLCFLLEEEGTLFTGDHVMQGSTVIINPPDGDMGAYLASLRLLQEMGLQWLAPGHGRMIGDPAAALERLVRHRLMREAKVMGALERGASGTLRELVVHVYDDVPAERHGIAERSLEAHLLKLLQEGRVSKNGEAWGLA